MLALWNKISDILKAPFVGTLDLESLFWLIGAVLVFIGVWAFIMTNARRAATEVI